MKYQTIHSRKMRYGSMAVSLTVTLIAALVLLNVAFSTLARHFNWYWDMTPEKSYTLSDTCRELLRDAIDDVNQKAAAAGEEPVTAEILFCEDYRNYETGSVGSYIYTTAHDLELAFPDTVSVSWFNCWVEKKRADELGVKASTNVVLKLSNGQSRVFTQKEFFSFANGNTTSPVGYDGERALATTLVSLMYADRPLACITVNHDEIFYDYQLVYLLRDAGYNFSYIDLFRSEIPEECELLVCYNPNADFIDADGVADTSEVARVREFLAGGGNLAVFLESDTPVLPNLEALLAEWGVSVERAYDSANEMYFNCMVKDSSASLTSDGFSVVGTYADAAAEALAPMLERDYLPKVIFRDSTAFRAADGFTGGNGSYTNGTRTLTTLFTPSDNAELWANGSAQPKGSDRPALMTLSSDSATGAHVLVLGSSDYATEDYLQSAVFGNSDAVLCALQAMGKEHLLLGLHYKPYSTSAISSITTSQTLHWTLWLSIVPAVLVPAVAITVLVRRKNT